MLILNIFLMIIIFYFLRIIILQNLFFIRCLNTLLLWVCKGIEVHMKKKKIAFEFEKNGKKYFKSLEEKKLNFQSNPFPIQYFFLLTSRNPLNLQEK